MRTISEPASASSLTWIAVPIASTVSVLVIDCTRTGASPPTVTTRVPQRTLAWRERRGGRPRRHDERHRRAERSSRIDRSSAPILELDAATLSRVSPRVDRLTAKASCVPARCRCGRDTAPRRRGRRLAGLDQARQQGVAARVGDLDPGRRRVRSWHGADGAAGSPPGRRQPAPALDRRRQPTAARSGPRRRSDAAPSRASRRPCGCGAAALSGAAHDAAPAEPSPRRRQEVQDQATRRQQQRRDPEHRSRAPQPAPSRWTRRRPDARETARSGPRRPARAGGRRAAAAAPAPAPDRSSAPGRRSAPARA